MRPLVARQCRLVVLTVSIVGILGCGSGNARVYPAGGRVVFRGGKPLPGGWVSFRSVATGAMSRGEIQPDGTFELTTRKPGDGAVEGRHQVLVVVPPARAYSGPGAPAPLPPIDAKFTGFDTSGLEFTVTTNPSESRFTIEVEGLAKAK
jgi:hypothetical protein